jgi:hypothetical protein
MEGATVSEGGSWLPKTWPEAIGQSVWGVLILGWGLELIISVLDVQWARAFFALAGGVAFLAVLVHSEELRNRLMAINPNWVVAAAFVCLLVLILSPFIEEKRWPFSAWSSQSAQAPSANEIAAAVIKALPKQTSGPDDSTIRAERDRARSDLAAVTAERDKLKNELDSIPKRPPYVNPLHDPILKWGFVSSLQNRFKNGGITPECRVTIVQTPESYAQDFAADFEQILDAANWKYFSQIATSPVRKGISVRAAYDDAKSKECADSLVSIIGGQTRTRSGSSMDDPHQWIRSDDPGTPNYLKNCPAGCIEVSFGLDDGR